VLEIRRGETGAGGVELADLGQHGGGLFASVEGPQQFRHVVKNEVLFEHRQDVRGHVEHKVVDGLALLGLPGENELCSEVALND